jgi:hypothetical protein
MDRLVPGPTRFLRLGLVVGLSATLLALLSALLTPTPAAAADLREFNPGSIITDQVFFDSGSMSPAGVQAFLDDKGSACVRGADGSPCLRSYRQDTTSRPGSVYCPSGYQGAGQESAATIIFKVAQACGVNPQVLLVTLQKEMGFIRSTNPTAKMYERAMGYGCPDNSTGVCDSAYYGLQNQLYSAASQFQRYVKNPTNYSYRAGITNYILYHPYNSCGRQAVYIQNGATAALYNYTPYVPNSAALNAGYGTGDGCSAYGNRNFFSYFTDWFGSTQSTGSGAINLRYMALGGTGGELGAPIAATQCGLAAGGCARAYVNASIYWSPSSGAAVVQGDVRAGWWSTGGIDGPMGYPIADSGPVAGGAAGAFQGGSVYWSPRHRCARRRQGAAGELVVRGRRRRAARLAGRQQWPGRRRRHGRSLPGRLDLLVTDVGGALARRRRPWPVVGARRDQRRARLPDQRPGRGSRRYRCGVPGRLHLLLARHGCARGVGCGAVGLVGPRWDRRSARLPDRRHHGGDGCRRGQGAGGCLLRWQPVQLVGDRRGGAVRERAGRVPGGGWSGGAGVPGGRSGAADRR